MRKDMTLEEQEQQLKNVSTQVRFQTAMDAARKQFSESEALVSLGKWGKEMGLNIGGNFNVMCGDYRRELACEAATDLLKSVDRPTLRGHAYQRPLATPCLPGHYIAALIARKTSRIPFCSCRYHASSRCLRLGS